MVTLITGRARGGTTAVACVCEMLSLPLIYTEKTRDDHELGTHLEDEEKLKALISQRGDNWAAKHPNILNEKVFEDNIEDVRWIFVHRDPCAVALGNYSRGGTLVKGIRINAEQNDKMARMNVKNSLHVSYEKLLVRTERVVKEIAEFLDLSVGNNMQDIVKFIQPEKGYDTN